MVYPEKEIENEIYISLIRRSARGCDLQGLFLKEGRKGWSHIINKICFGVEFV